MFLGVGENIAEESLLEYAKKIIFNNSTYKLRIFLHPIEKSNNDVYGRACKFYVDYFKGTEIKIESIDYLQVLIKL